MINKNLRKAKKEKNDEFFTQMVDIEKEMEHYKEHFKGKIVYCNCDTVDSNFYIYFKKNYGTLGLKGLLRSSLIDSVPFQSDKGIELLEQADIVVTNPPFSLFREFVALMMTHNKKFLIIGNQNAITYKECFKHIKDNNMWLGVTAPKVFLQPDNTTKTFGNICWFTNLSHNKRNENLILYKKYTPEEYPTYDNYDAINVDKVKDIPLGYFKTIGVPITFLNKFNPAQFEIVKFRYGDDGKDLTINSKEPYCRILIKVKTQ